ncbi:MAG: hypothetical protein EBU08_14405, partial [Micrococcales bacterium]|nr:hypothetical protein [Micrococcales bacterium]
RRADRRARRSRLRADDGRRGAQDAVGAHGGDARLQPADGARARDRPGAVAAARCRTGDRDPAAEPICRGWCLDHDYETEKFRGWICQTCNIGLGHFKDSIEGMMKGIEYLKRTGG